MARRLLVLSVQIVIEDGEEGISEIVQDLLHDNLTNSSIVVDELSCDEIADENI